MAHAHRSVAQGRFIFMSRCSLSRVSLQLHRDILALIRIVSLALVTTFMSLAAHAQFANGTGIAQVSNIGTHATGSRSLDEGLAIALQSDGKIVIAGRCVGANPNYRFCVARLNADGTADASFDGGVAAPAIPGKVIVPNLTAAVGVAIRAARVAIDSNGRIVVASTCSTVAVAERFCVARLLSNGAPDASFDGPDAANPGNSAFIVPISAANSERLFDMTLQKIDGRIVLVGTCGDYTCIARLRATDGSFDDNSNDFGFLKPSDAARAPIDPAANGRGIWRQPSYFNSGGSGGARGVVTTAEGKVLVVGTCGINGATTQICMTKFNRDGTFDDDFRGDSLPIGSGGRLVINSIRAGGNVIPEVATAVKMQADGRFLLQCGHFNTSSISQCMYRINSGGDIATSWDSGLQPPSTAGRVVYNSVGTSLGFTITPSGTLPGDPYANRVIALGDCSGVGGNSGSTRICVTALRNGTGGPPNGDGTIDPNLIGPNGNADGTFFQSTATPATATGNVVHDVVANGNGEFFIVGDCDDRMCVYKFRPDGALDTSPCNKDVDGDARVSAASDGIALIRAMLAVPGAPTLPAGLGYDIDGNGTLSAASDGLLFVRGMLGFTGSSLTNGVSLGSGARRTASLDIESYLRTRCNIQ
jgi:uncharacterized delta-60 repeat protein